MRSITSADGTTLAYDQLGEGPVLILVAGAACDRGVNAPVAQALATNFTVFNYDRRGRGDSADTPPYAVAREVEDIAALVAAAGGAASVLGFSSGAALAAEATASGLPVERLIMWEPPFSTDPDGPRRAKEYADRLAELLAADRRGDALAHFMTHVGVPREVIAGARLSPYWQAGLRLAPTLAHDAAILGDTTIPIARYAEIAVPTLVLSGSESPEFLRAAAERTAGAIPGARHDVLPGQDHNVAGESLVANQVRSLVATGHMSVGAFATPDCWATYRDLRARGVEFIEEPEERFYGIDAAFRDPFGNHWRLTQRKPIVTPPR